MKGYVSASRLALPALHITFDDKIASRITLQGTHKGELAGIPATGKQIKVAGLSIDRLEDGKFVETFAISDVLGMLRQLGVAPTPGQA